MCTRKASPMSKFLPETRKLIAHILRYRRRPPFGWRTLSQRPWRM